MTKFRDWRTVKCPICGDEMQVGGLDLKTSSVILCCETCNAQLHNITVDSFSWTEEHGNDVIKCHTQYGNKIVKTDVTAYCHTEVEQN